MKKHYHVLSGLNGLYMPDSNDVYRTLEEARDGMRWHRDQSAQQDGYYQKGAVTRGWIAWGIKGMRTEYPYSIELRDCTDPDCLSDIED